jgi:hypothetical protein
MYQPNSITYLHFPKSYLASSPAVQEQAHTGNMQSNKFLSPSCNKYSASRDILLLLLLILRLLQYSFYLVVRKAANCAPEAVLRTAISIRYFLFVFCRQATARVPPGFPNDAARFTCKPSHLNTST